MTACRRDGDTEVTMVLWDLHGDDKLRQVRASHLKGASGFLLVVDGTRRTSLEAALAMRGRLAESLAGVPFVVACNKSDLRHQWELADTDIENLRRQGIQVALTSAKDGSGVEQAFADLAGMLVS